MDTMVKLTPSEQTVAASVGAARRIASVGNSDHDYTGSRGSSGWQIDIEGACGELAFAKLSGLFWNSLVGVYSAVPDVGSMFEVRTISKTEHSLIIRTRDHDDRVYVLMFGSCPHYKALGAISGAEAKSHKEWMMAPCGREEAWFVPQLALHSIDRYLPMEVVF